MKWFIVFALLGLGACAQTSAMKSAIAVKGAELSDTGLQDAVWWTCKGASVGSVKRMYGQTLERATTYREFCEGSGDTNVIAP